ncbi:MAG: hypothetical protein AAF512_22755 [Pseudomonadota bacterium]
MIIQIAASLLFFGLTVVMLYKIMRCIVTGEIPKAASGIGRTGPKRQVFKQQSPREFWSYIVQYSVMAICWLLIGLVFALGMLP